MKNKIEFSISELENKIISKKNRYKLTKIEETEIKKTLLNQNILISGACGSIGKFFTKKILNHDFKNLYLLDKNENDLVELNRDITLSNTKKIKKIEYICTDITSFSLDDFLLKNKIHHYYNFAAIKHVRSEEYLDSLKYMFKTNSSKFCPNKKNNLKIFFSISSDKAVLPQSFLGISKYFMEEKLSDFAKKNKSVFVSSVRFANVSFSEGSYLKYAKERITTTQVTFNDFQYSSNFNMESDESGVAEFDEKFKFKNGKTRHQKHKLYMEDEDIISATAQECGFTIHAIIDMIKCAYEQQYLYVFVKPN